MSVEVCDEFFDDGLQFGDVGLNGVPQLDGAYLVVAMDEHMPHPLDVIPFDFAVLIAVVLGEHIDSLADDLDMFDESIEHDGVRRQCVCPCFLTAH